ncbi:hypothetical protein HYC85_017652 [Camellia sinensis]|uniref:Uncharacterized protein n=1 Tax=Camellia sinensis TaxID=4442 RepID=A0A7J7GTP4_CAMSI|nr:hypothetical protein HYC85_017652 [Camellia sinensis]
MSETIGNAKETLGFIVRDRHGRRMFGIAYHIGKTSALVPKYHARAWNYCNVETKCIEDSN